jgi:hypothetical protein
MAVIGKHLGTEIDQCSGQLSVKNSANHWINVTRGQMTQIEVDIDGGGYWYWRCGSSDERARGDDNFRQRVRFLQVHHSTEGREIRWECFAQH